MIFHQSYVELTIYRAKQREMEKKLEIARLLRAEHGDRFGFWRHLLSRVGDVLIALGLLLKERYEPGGSGSSPGQSVGYLTCES